MSGEVGGRGIALGNRALLDELEALGVLLVFDRILDMSRTATNVFGDACCTVIVARLQGEELPRLERSRSD